MAALKRWGADASAVVRERNRVAKQELGAKGWLEARELVRGVADAGWEDVRGISEGRGGEVGTLAGGSGDADQAGVASRWGFME